MRNSDIPKTEDSPPDTTPVKKPAERAGSATPLPTVALKDSCLLFC